MNTVDQGLRHLLPSTIYGYGILNNMGKSC